MDKAKIDAEVARIETAVRQINASWTVIKSELESEAPVTPDPPQPEPEPAAWKYFAPADRARWNPDGWRDTAGEPLRGTSVMLLPRWISAGNIASAYALSGSGATIEPLSVYTTDSEGRPHLTVSIDNKPPHAASWPSPTLLEINLKLSVSGGNRMLIRLDNPRKVMTAADGDKIPYRLEMSK